MESLYCPNDPMAGKGTDREVIGALENPPVSGFTLADEQSG